MADNSAEYELRLKDLFSGPLERIEQKLNGFERKMTSVGDIAAGSFGGIMFANAAMKAIDLVEKVGASIVELGTNMQKVRISFTTLLGGDAGYADQMIAKFQKFAQMTPFNTQDVLQGAKRLRAYRYEAEDIIPTMKKLGDITAGLDLNFSDVVWLVGHTKSLGYADRRIIREFALRGIGIEAEIMKNKGMSTTAEFDAQVKKRLITYQDIDRALTSMTSKGGMFFNLSEKLGATVAGRWERLKDTLEIMGTRMGEQLLPMLSRWLDQAFEIVNKFAHVDMSSTIASFDELLTLGKSLYKTFDAFFGLFREEATLSDTTHGILESFNRIARALGYLGESAALIAQKLMHPFTSGKGLFQLWEEQDQREIDIQNKRVRGEKLGGFNTKQLIYNVTHNEKGDILGPDGKFHKRPNMFGSEGGEGEEGYTGAGIEKIAAGSRNITLNITKLIETVNFEKSYTESEAQLLEHVKRALVMAVNDVNIVAN